VWNCGWSYDEFLFCARNLSLTILYDVIGVRTAGAIREVVGGFLGTEGYVETWNHLFFTADLGWPYGLEGEPDAPV